MLLEYAPVLSILHIPTVHHSDPFILIQNHIPNSEVKFDAIDKFKKYGHDFESNMQGVFGSSSIFYWFYVGNGD